MRLRSLPDRVRRTLERELRRVRGIDEKVVRLPAEGGAARGRALFSYIVDPFLLPPGAELPHSHTHFWESRTMARTLCALGFEVDAIHWTNRTFVPRERYDLLVDVRLNLERLGPALGPECLKVMHAETAHASFYNPAQLARLAALEARRGIRLAPFKMLEPNRAIESADCATLVGNERTQSTYRFAGKPLWPVPISQPVLYPFPEGKDFAAARSRFLWFGSGGMVHKGLDLVLDAFAGLPDLHLTVCGPVERERAFESAYARELYATPNIHAHGWIDVAGPEFADLARRTLALVYPSCSEGQNGGTVTCLHAGLLAVVTPEVGVDVDSSFGLLLAEPSVDAIRAAAVELSRRDPDGLAAMARRAWQFARERHTRERFAAEYRRAMVEILHRFRPGLAGQLAL
jgi:glycosyltransferase involved in cell wall biosynthesis